jgi:hypothetical protein
MQVENYFLRYAFPCSMVLKQRGEVDDETVAKLERAAINNDKVDRKLLEKVYFRAISRIKALAKEMNKDYWDLVVIKEYFLKRHNELLDGLYAGRDDRGLDIDPKAPKFLKNLCKVFVANILEKGEDYYVVEYDNGKKRTVSNALVPNADINDKVTIHYGYAVELLK